MPPKKTKAERAAATAAARAAAAATKKRKTSEIAGDGGGEGDGGAADVVPPHGSEPDPEPATSQKKTPATAAPSGKGKAKATQADEEEAELRELREEPCDRCVRSALNGVSYGDCRVGSATKCARCVKGETPCFPLPRAALLVTRRFLESKATEGTPRKDLARMSATLRTLLGEEEEEARKKLKVGSGGEEAGGSVPHVGAGSLGSDHGATVKPPVVSEAVRGSTSSSASAVSASVSLRRAIDSLVSTVVPEAVRPVLRGLLDHYVAALRAER